MKLVICLGNPGNNYAKTRHNAGFMFADILANKINCKFNNEPKFKAHIAKGEYNNEAIWIVKPQTFMNLSGEALAALKNFYKIDIKTLFVVYDDISLDVGKIRFRAKGSDGGHNGIKSIIKNLKTICFKILMFNYLIMHYVCLSLLDSLTCHRNSTFHVLNRHE